MTTLADILDKAGVGVLGVLDAQVDVPVLCGAQAQGDLIVLPRPLVTPASTPIPMGGVEVVSGEAGGNSHSLLSWDGPECCWEPSTGGDSLVLGVLTVPLEATAYLVHTEEHGANAFGPGTYEVRRQREQAETVRLVND